MRLALAPFALLLVIPLAGCPSTEKHDDAPRPQAAVTTSQDPPPPAWATSEVPEFDDPKPPVSTSAKASGDESMRERLLHDEKR